MKPESIKKFDLTYIGSMIVSVVGTLLAKDAMMNAVNDEIARQGPEAASMAGMAEGMIWFGVGIGIALSLLLWALVSIWRIEFVKWIIGLLTAYSVVSVLMGIGQSGFETYMLGGIVSTALSIAALYFLFQPDATAWLREKRG